MRLDDSVIVRENDCVDFGCWEPSKGRLCFRFFDNVDVSKWIIFESIKSVRIIIGASARIKLVDKTEEVDYEIQNNAIVWHVNMSNYVQTLSNYALYKNAHLYHRNLGYITCTAESRLSVNLLEFGASVDWREGDCLRNGAERKLQISIDHQAPCTESNCWVKGVVYDNASFKFLCDVFIQKSAEGSVVHQRNLNHIMSSRASICTLPRLHVENKHIEASHGTATQPIPRDAITYLQMRGLTMKQAEQLYLESFLKETEMCNDGGES